MIRMTIEFSGIKNTICAEKLREIFIKLEVYEHKEC